MGRTAPRTMTASQLRRCLNRTLAGPAKLVFRVEPGDSGWDYIAVYTDPGGPAAPRRFIGPREMKMGFAVLRRGGCGARSATACPADARSSVSPSDDALRLR